MKIKELLAAPDGPIDILKIMEDEAYAQVGELVDAGILPADTFLKLDTISDNTTDGDGVYATGARRGMLHELVAFAESPDDLSPLTRSIIFGEPPKALIVWDSTVDEKTLRTLYERPFLLRSDLAEVVRLRRVAEGKTVTTVPKDRRWRPPEDVEAGQCMRIAHGLWRVMAQRIVPEWLKPSTVEYYYRPHKFGTRIDVSDSRRVMNRRIVGAVALKVDHIKDIYDESLKVGVRGIGPVGRTDLRTLLAEEYLELQ